jgi:hypothetical protein
LALEGYHEDGDEFLNQVVWVTGNETGVSFVNIETIKQSKIWMHRHIHQMSQRYLDKYLPIRKLMGTIFWDGTVVLMIQFMQQGTKIMSDNGIQKLIAQYKSSVLAIC